MRNYFIFAGKSSQSFQTILSGEGVYTSPERDVEMVEVAGRNGELTFDKGRFKNRPVIYKCCITEKFVENYEALINHLCSYTGYQRLEDTYHTDTYRLARLKGTIEPDVAQLHRSGEFQIEFDCKPQRFLKSGEEMTEYAYTGSSRYLTNPTAFAAKPLVRVYGTGTVTIGSTTITVNKCSTYVDIDCELQDAYKGTTNCNGDIRLTSGDFFTLKPGSNYISMSSTITKIQITPRWFKI